MPMNPASGNRYRGGLISYEAFFISEICHLKRILSVLAYYGEILFSANTIHQMIVHEPCGLQVGITDGRSKEFKATFFHVSAHGV